MNSNDAPRLAELGTTCPDHFLRTKIKPLYVDWNPQTETFGGLKRSSPTGLEQYREGLRRLLRTVQARRIRPRCATRTRP